MVSAANLLLGAAAPPEQTQSPGGAEAAQDQDPSSSPFLALVQGLMGPVEAAEADPVRAGQQAVEDEQTSDGDEPLRDATIQSCLLGSVQIACSEVQALPSQVVTDASVAKEATPAAAESSTTEVAPNPAQPTAVEQPAEADPGLDPGLDPGPATAVKADGAVEPPPDATVETVVPAKADELPVVQGKSAQVIADAPEQASQASKPAVEQASQVGKPAVEQPEPQSPQPGPKADVPEDRSVPREITARRQAERPEVAEHLRSVVPQEANRPVGRLILGQDARSVQPVTDADPELAAMPVERPDQREISSSLPRAENSIQWMPIEARPVGEIVARPVAVTTQSQPVDQVDRTNIIHQIVRTAKVQVFDGGGEMVMRLEPAHLGSIRMSVTADHGVVAANLRVGSESVRQALEAGIVTLRQSLADSGIRVDSISVSVGDNLSQGWNLHAGGQNGSQHADSRQNGYPARLAQNGSDAGSMDQPSASHISAGFNYLA